MAKGNRGGKRGSGNTSYRNTEDYKDAYADEIKLRQSEAPVPGALPSQSQDDDTVETQMRGYASAIGDPIKAMENYRDSIKREYYNNEYDKAQSDYDKGYGEAMVEMMGQYDQAIDRMKKIKKNSKRPDLL